MYIRGTESGWNGLGEMWIELLMLRPTRVWMLQREVDSEDRRASSAWCPPAASRPHPLESVFGMKERLCKCSCWAGSDRRKQMDRVSSARVCYVSAWGT